MEIEKLSIFVKDTSAYTTNRAFYYQYLHTLYEWLNIYISKSDAAIYCEYGDDIAIETEKSITFKQVKHYTEKLNLNSSAIKKTLFNCFILYIKYFEYIESVKDTMFFIVSNVESKDPIIKNWEFYKKKSFKGYEDLTIKQVRSIIGEKIESKKTKSISDRRIKKEESKVKRAEIVASQYNDMITIVNDTDWYDFCSRLTFSSNNDTIDSLKENILTIISGLNDSIPDTLVYARLLITIIEESSKNKSEKNKLNRSLLDCILKESQKEMSERIIVSYDVFKELYDELIGPDLEGIKSIIEQNHEISKKTYAKTDKIDEKTDKMLSLLTELASKKEIGKEATISNIPHRDINMNERVLHERTLTCDKLFEIVDERINNFINDGKFYEAKEIIDKILDSTSFSDYPLYFTDSLKQKLGVIFLNTGDIEKAKRVLEDLVKSSTRNKNICIFMVTMAAIIKDEQLKNSAIHQLKELGENEDGIKLSLCKYYNILGEFEKALEIITQNNNIKDCYKENAHALELMGDILFRTERYSEAAYYFKKSDNLKPTWYKKFQLILSKSNEIISGIGSLYLLTDEQKDILLTKYKELCTLENYFTELHIDEIAIFYNLKLSILLFANPDEFENEYHILNEKIKSLDSIKVTYADYISIYKDEDAINIYQEIFSKSQDTDLLKKILFSLLRRRKYSDVIKILENYGYNSFDEDGIMAEIYLEALKHEKGLEYAINKYNDLKERFNKFPFFHRYALILYFEHGLYNELESIANNLMRSIKEDNYKPRYIFSETLENAGLINHSIEIIMPLTRSSFKAMKRYITLLVKTKDSGNKKEALKLINTLIAEKRCDNELFSLKGQILFEGDKGEAFNACLKSFELKASNAAAVNTVNLALELNKIEGLENVISYLKRQNDPICTTILSKYYYKMGQKQTSEYYFVRSIALLGEEFDENIYRHFIFFAFISENQEEKIEFEKVELNTAIELFDEDQNSIWICIHAEKGLIPEEGIRFGGCINYSSESKECIILKNRKLNNCINMFEKNYTIRSIISRKAKMIRHCMGMFSKKCPDYPYLRTIHVSPNDAISPILPHLIKQKERREFLLRQYNFENGIGLPLYTFADKDYSTHIDSILGLMNTKNQIFYAGEPGFFKLNRETKIVITYSSLLIMNYLKKLENLIKIKDLIIMPKAVEYAILKAYEHSESFDTRLFGTMAINEDGRPVFFKLTEEEKANRLSFWKDITLFIKTVRTIQLDKKLDIEELQIMRELIGDADLECISLAYKQKAILISDDLFVRRATNSFNKNIMSSNIIPILLHTVDDAVELIDCLLLLSNGDYFILYSREVLNSLFDKISQYPPIFSEDTIWGKTQMILRNSLRLPALFKAYIPILLDVYEFLYDSISFKSKNMFMKLIIEEIKHANKTMGLNDIVFINIMKERFGLDIIKYNYFIKMYKPS